MERSREDPLIGLPPSVLAAQLSLERWICTICTKKNIGTDSKCVVCGRDRGYISLEAYLPFHPPCKTFEGASKFLDYRKIEAFLSAGIDPDVCDSDGWTGLFWATALSRLDLMELYIKYKADVNKQRIDGWTPLHMACQVGDESGCLLLLHSGANPDIVGFREGFTPLHVAAKEGSKECIEALGLAGANINLPSKHSNFTPVHIACIRGHYDCVVSLILVSGDPLRTCRKDIEPLDVKCKDADGWSPYHLAKLRGHKHIVRLLESHGVGEDTKTIDASSYVQKRFLYK